MGKLILRYSIKVNGSKPKPKSFRKIVNNQTFV